MELKELSDAVIAGHASEAQALTKAALEQDFEAQTIMDESLISAMQTVGAQFGRGEIYVPEMLLSARAMQSCLTLLDPLLASSARTKQGVAVVGTVKGDVHDIGKNIVAIMLKGAGFAVVDMGVDVSADRFVEAVKEHQPDILGLSALLTTTMPGMETVIGALERAGIRDTVKVMVGGAPVTEEFAQSIGADGYGKDAGVAAERAKELVAVP
jgi:5-methyltetrahydrofolate--homocysteine methyltransferase